MKVNMKGHDPNVFENEIMEKVNFHEFGSMRDWPLIQAGPTEWPSKKSISKPTHFVLLS